jgi:hypothetical protein
MPDPTYPTLTVPPRPADWTELAIALAVGFLAGFAIALVIAASTAHAGGVVVTWQQPSDCPAIDAWELLAAPNPSASPSPSSAQVVATIPNGPPVICDALTQAVAVNVLGPTRFWLRSIENTSGLVSGPSNAVDASVPLGKPVGLTVVVP